MSFLQTRKTVHVRTDLPASVSIADVVALVHDHARYVPLQSLVASMDEIDAPADHEDLIKSCEEVEASSEAWTWYQVAENVPLVGTVRFLTAIQNRPDGSQAVVFPSGLKMYNRLRVVGNEKTGVAAVEEDAVMYGNLLLMPFVKRTYRNAHVHLHENLIKRLTDEKTSS